MQDTILSLLQPELVAEAAAQWDSSGEALLLDDVTNMVYEFSSPHRRRILRLTHSSHHSEAEILAELDWLSYLIEHGIPASRPLRSKNERLTECFPVPDSYFVAAAFEFAPGSFVQWDNAQEWDAALIRNFGRIVGRMHHLTKGYNPQHLSGKRAHWHEEELLQHALDYLPVEQRQVAADLEAILLRFSRLTPTIDDYGLVHNDLNPTNFHVQDGQITLFDFDDCAYNWFINDLSIALPLYSKMFTQRGWEAKVTQFLGWYLGGYAQENHLDEGWLEYLPACLQMQNMITLVALHQSNIPNSRYHWFYERVLKIYREGHPLFQFDFRKAYRSLA